MLGCISPAGFVLWIPSAALGATLVATGFRSPRFFFSFVVGIGLTLIGLGITNDTYLVMLLYGGMLVAGGTVFFAAFGPRVSRADPPDHG